MLGLLEMWTLRQAEKFGSELAASSSDALDEWNKHAARALVPRIGKLAAWTKKATIEAQLRVALEGFTKRWRKRADDCTLDWAELLTAPVMLREGFEGTDVTARDIERLVAWVKRQLAKPQSAPVDDKEKRSVTIAGDTAQRLVFDNIFTGWASLLQVIATGPSGVGGQPAIVRPLKLSYR